MAKVLKPLYDRVVLKVIMSEQTSGGLFVARGAIDSRRAEVVAVGPGKYNADTGEYTRMHVVPGDIVMVNTMLGNPVKWNDDTENEYVLMKEDDIQAVEVECEDR